MRLKLSVDLRCAAKTTYKEMTGLLYLLVGTWLRWYATSRRIQRRFSRCADLSRITNSHSTPSTGGVEYVNSALSTDAKQGIGLPTHVKHILEVLSRPGRHGIGSVRFSCGCTNGCIHSRYGLM